MGDSDVIGISTWRCFLPQEEARERSQRPPWPVFERMLPLCHIPPRRSDSTSPKPAPHLPNSVNNTDLQGCWEREAGSRLTTSSLQNVCARIPWTRAFGHLLCPGPRRHSRGHSRQHPCPRPVVFLLSPSSATRSSPKARPQTMDIPGSQ